MAWILAAGVLPSLLLAPADARAQDDEGYAWGEEGGGSTGNDIATGEDPLRIQAMLGGGVGFRILRNLDYDQQFIVPPYIDLGAAVYLPGQELRHGVGLGVSTILTNDADTLALTQWVLTPSYQLNLPFQRLLAMDQDILQLQFRVGIPVVFSHVSGSGPNVTFGGEIGASFIVKFLAGLGVYLEVQGAIYGGYRFTFHPVVSIDAGFVLDYEVLP
ncbi:MAG: hypothetical protein AB7S26_39575 [Sandaracinaceae bacterium]